MREDFRNTMYAVHRLSTSLLGFTLSMLQQETTAFLRLQSTLLLIYFAQDFKQSRQLLPMQPLDLSKHSASPSPKDYLYNKDNPSNALDKLT